MVGSVLMAAGLSFGGTFLVCLLIRCAGRSWPLRAEGDGRSIGGLALLVGLLLGLIPSFLSISPFLFLGAGVVVLVGLLDDLIGLFPWRKLLGLGVAAALAAVGLSSIQSLSIATTLHLGGAQWLVTFLWALGLMNAMNLIDGLDGLVVTALFPPLMVLVTIAFLTGNAVGALFAVAVLAILIGFYPFNHYQARLLLGDTGAGLLGYLLAILTLMILNRDPKGWSILPALFLAAVPLSDTTFAIFRRLACGRSIFQRDKEHIHHRLAARFGTGRAVAGLATISLFSSCMAFFLWWLGI